MKLTIQLKLSKIAHALKKFDVAGKLDDGMNARNIIRCAYPLILLSLLLMVLLYIEYKHPYFFLQDDNRDTCLPYFVYYFESLLKGELAVYNFHQFLGSPLMPHLYPITYLSVFLSDLFFGHYFAAIDIYVILHLLIGSIGVYRFIQIFSVDRNIAFFAGLTWPLSSFIIYVSNSWNVVAPVAAYFPWMMFFSFRLYQQTTPKTSIYAVIVRLLLFYTGYIQYFICSVIFEFITVVLYVVSESKPGDKKVNFVKFFKKYIEEYVYVFICALPLLLPMWHQTTISADRSDRLSFGVFVSQYFPMDQLILGLLYPFLQVNEYTYASFRNMLNLSHIGYLTIIFLVFGTIEKFIKRSKKNEENLVNLAVFVRPAMISFLWSTNWVFNLLIYNIPILNRFRWPFKIAVYFDFYLIIIAALMLSYLVTRISWKETTKNFFFFIIIIIQIFNFVFLYTVSPYKDFGEHHGDNVPLEENLQDKLIGGRIISIGFDIWTPTPENNQRYLTAPTLGFNYATLWGLDYFAGYDPFLPKVNAEACFGLNFTAILEADARIPVDYFRETGVRWYIVPKNKANEYSKKFNIYGIIEKYTDDNRVVFYDDRAYPMVFNSKGEKFDSQDYKVTANTIELSVYKQQSDGIIFNNLYNSFFEGFIDGKKTELTPINTIHFSISVPAGNHHVMIKYKNPYFITGTYIAIMFLIICMIRYVLNRKFN